MHKAFTDRSRIETYQRCHRRRFLEYHEADMGLTLLRKPLPLAMGGSVHIGIGTLLREAQALLYACPNDTLDIVVTLPRWRVIEDLAVADALKDFAQYASAGLELDAIEQGEMSQPAEFADLLAGSVGKTAEEAGLGAPEDRVAKARTEYDRYLAEEQSALVEAMVRAYARRRLQPLLAQYEVLEVEREGQWMLYSDIKAVDDPEFRGNIMSPGYEPIELWFMSRPDALLLERDSRQLSLLSLKTTAGWDVRKERDAQHDMQGLSEGVEVELRLREWWSELKHSDSVQIVQICKALNISDVMRDYLLSLSEPPRVAAIRYEFMLKGDRREDKELSAHYQVSVRSQRSHLIRGYHNPGMAAGDEQWNWSWDFLKPDGTGEPSKLYYKNWRSTPIWVNLPIARWIDMLDSAVMTTSGEDATVGMAPRELGYKCEAQATGYTAEHPLDSIFLPPLVLYRNDDELRDCVEQIEAQELQVARNVRRVREARDEAERRSLLNQLFPQSRHSCEFPSACPFSNTATRPGVCWASADTQRDPMSSGQYTRRVPNHPQELVEIKAGEIEVLK